jgi:hypothetical protein
MNKVNAADKEESFVSKHLLTVEKNNRKEYVKDLDRIINKLFFHFTRIADKLPKNADVGAIGAVTLVELRNLRDTIKNYDK